MSLSTTLRKRGLALFLALTMCLSMIQTAFAYEDEAGTGPAETEVTDVTGLEPSQEDDTIITDAAEPSQTEDEVVLDDQEVADVTEPVEEPEEEDEEDVSEPAAEEVPAEVQMFLNAAAALPAPYEVTAANAVAVGDEVNAVIGMWDAMSAELANREDVLNALNAVYAVYEAVLAAEEIPNGRTYVSDSDINATISAFHAVNGEGTNYLENINDFYGLQDSRGELLYSDGYIDLDGENPVVDGGPIYLFPNLYWVGEMFMTVEPITDFSSVQVSQYTFMYDGYPKTTLQNGETATLDNGAKVTVNWTSGYPAKIYFTFDSDQELDDFDIYIKVNFSFGQQNHSGKTFTGSTVFYYGKGNGSSAPGAPSPVSKSIIEKTPVKVNVACKEYQTTGHKNYLEYWTNTANRNNFALKNNAGGYTVGPVVANQGGSSYAPADDFPWQCTVTLKNSYWVQQYNNSYSRTLGTHYLDPSVGTFEIVYYSDGDDWYYITIDTGSDKDLVGNFWVWVTCTNPVTPTTYTVTREYYTNGVQDGSSTVTRTGNVGDVFTGQELANANSDWTTYTPNGAESAYTYEYKSADPTSLTLTANTANNKITLRYERTVQVGPTISDLGVFKTPSEEYPVVGKEFSYVIKVTNSHKDAATVKVTDVLPDGLTFVKANENGTYDENTRTVTWASVYVPGNGSKEVKVWVTASKTGEIDNEARAELNGKTTSGNTSVTVKPEVPTLDEVNNLVPKADATKGTVKVTCAPKRHDPAFFGYGTNGERVQIGGVRGNATSGYTSSVTFLAAAYAKAYSDYKDRGTHTLVEGQENVVVNFNWNADTQKWELADKNQAPVEFQVQCEPDTYNYRVEYDLAGGTGTFDAQTAGPVEAISHEFTLSTAVPTKDGYIFLGWSDAADGKVTVTSTDPTKVVEDVTYHYKTVAAEWVSLDDVSIGVTKTIQKQIIGTDGSTGWRDLNKGEKLVNGDVVRYIVVVKNTSKELALTDLQLFDDMDAKLTGVKNIKISKERTATSYYFPADEANPQPLLQFKVDGILEVNDTYTVWYEAVVQNTDGTDVENTATAYADPVMAVSASIVQYTSGSASAGGETDNQTDVSSGDTSGGRPGRPTGGVSGTGSTNTGTTTPETPDPDEPTPPTAQEVNTELRDSSTLPTKSAVVVYCEPKRHQIGYFGCYKNEDGNITQTDRIKIGEVVKNVDGDYTCDVTFLAEKYAAAYSALKKGVEHKLVENEGNKTVTFKWTCVDAEKNTYAWKLANGVTGPVEFNVKCAASNLTITKTADPTEVEVGGNVKYTITVVNTGDADAENVVITDKLDERLTFDNVTVSTGTVTRMGSDYTIGTVGAGAKVELVIAAKVNDKANVGDKISNSASVITTPENGKPTGTEVENPAVVEVVAPYPDVTLKYVDEKGNVLETKLVTVDQTNGSYDAGTIPEDYSKAGVHYVKVSNPDNASGTVTRGGTPVEIVVTYAKDTLSDPSQDKDNDPSNGDGIPDSWQYTVTYVAVNGHVTPGSTVVTKLDKDGNPSANGTATLAGHLPTSTSPNPGYSKGTWDVEPKADTVITGDTTFTITYTQIKVTVKPSNGTEMGTWPEGVTPNGNGDQELTPDENGKVTLPGKDDITPPDGKELDKWKDQDDKEYDPGAEITPDDDLTLTPVWKDITPDTVTVNAQNVTATYDGNGHPVTNVTFTKNGQIVNGTITGITYTETDSSAPVNAGTYTATITATVDGETVTGTATVTINRRNLTITANSDSKYYDGYALTNSAYTFSGDGLVGNDRNYLTVTVTGAQVIVGSSNNVPNYSWSNVVIGNNYAVTLVNGTLTVYTYSIPTPDFTYPTGGTSTPSTPSPAPSETITDDDVPLAGSVGLNDVEHFAYIIGYDDGTVRPLNNITRAEAATIFFRLMEEDYRNANWSTTNSFSDVNAGDWYNNAVSTCANAGILKGYADGTFRPNDPITRAEFASMAAGFMDASIMDDGTGDFSDTASHWAAPAIRRAAKAGWVTGNGNKFNPDTNISRAEVMTIVNRMLDRVPDAEHMLAEAKQWTDNPRDAWYYEAVQEATTEHDYERDEMSVETWTELLTARDWAALEAAWAEANAK